MFSGNTGIIITTVIIIAFSMFSLAGSDTVSCYKYTSQLFKSHCLFAYVHGPIASMRMGFDDT